MEFVNLAIKSVIALSIFALVYRFFLIQEVHFSGRRFYLIFSVILSFTLPLLSLDFSRIFSSIATPGTNLILDEITIYGEGIRTIAGYSAIPWTKILTWVYLSIVLILAAVSYTSCWSSLLKFANTVPAEWVGSHSSESP